jgi:hypothetical protein
MAVVSQRARRCKTMYRFKLGEFVRLKQTFPTKAPRGPYEVVRLLPVDGDVPLYRIKSRDENHERVAKETELTRHA